MAGWWVRLGARVERGSSDRLACSLGVSQAYATDALNWGKGLGETLTGAFSRRGKRLPKLR